MNLLIASDYDFFFEYLHIIDAIHANNNGGVTTLYHAVAYVALWQLLFTTVPGLTIQFFISAIHFPCPMMVSVKYWIEEIIRRLQTWIAGRSWHFWISSWILRSLMKKGRSFFYMNVAASWSIACMLVLNMANTRYGGLILIQFLCSSNQQAILSRQVLPFCTGVIVVVGVSCIMFNVSYYAAVVICSLLLVMMSIVLNK